MKNGKVSPSTRRLAQQLSKEQIIKKLKQRNLKGGIKCPPPFEPDGRS